MVQLFSWREKKLMVTTVIGKTTEISNATRAFEISVVLPLTVVTTTILDMIVVTLMIDVTILVLLTWTDDNLMMVMILITAERVAIDASKISVAILVLLTWTYEILMMAIIGITPKRVALDASKISVTILVLLTWTDDNPMTVMSWITAEKFANVWAQEAIKITVMTMTEILAVFRRGFCESSNSWISDTLFFNIYVCICFKTLHRSRSH